MGVGLTDACPECGAWHRPWCGYRPETAKKPDPPTLAPMRTVGDTIALPDGVFERPDGAMLTVRGGIVTVVDLSAKRPDPPTLERIKADVRDDNGRFWSAMIMMGTYKAITDLIDDAYDAGRRDATAWLVNAPAAIRERDTALAEVGRLEAWKSSAMAVMAPLQDIAKEFGLPLGVSITEATSDLMRRQRDEIIELRTANSKLGDERSSARAEGDRLFIMHNEAVLALHDTLVETDGLRAEIARLRNPNKPAPSPVIPQQEPIAWSARWDDGPGLRR